MIIGRFTRSTLSEWKGHNSCIIEVRGSTQRCPYLGQPELFDTDGPSIEEDEIVGYISEHLDSLDSIVIGGGEPLAQPDLYRFLKTLRKLKKPILLSTEGSDPATLDDLVGALMVDRVRINVPGPGLAPDAESCIRMLSDSGIEYEVMTCAVPGILTKDTISEIARTVKGKGTLVIRSFDPEKMADAELGKIKPYKKKDVLGLVESAKRHLKKVELRGF